MHRTKILSQGNGATEVIKVVIKEKEEEGETRRRNKKNTKNTKIRKNITREIRDRRILKRIGSRIGLVRLNREEDGDDKEIKRLGEGDGGWEERGGESEGDRSISSQ